jgi:hypothetical protein
MVQGPMAMSEPNFGPLGDESTDDLPRTFRREKEARAREARERAAQERAAAPSLPTGLSSGPDVRPSINNTGPAPQIHASADAMPAIADMPYPATVKRIDVPFVHLMRFFLKAVLAAIPALILLTMILWVLGQGLQTFFPDLVKLKILIGFQG